MTPKAKIERVEGVCTASGVGYEVIAPNGYHLGWQGEHIHLAETLAEARKMAKGVYPCECDRECFIARGEVAR